MSHKIVVGYDGSDSAKAALAFATDLAKAQGGSIVSVHHPPEMNLSDPGPAAHLPSPLA